VKYPIVPLGEVCHFVYGDGLKETDRKGGDIPVYGSNGIVGWHDEAITNGETIIVGRKGSIGEIHLSKIPCWAIDTTYYIDKTKVPCDFTWLYYTLKALDLTRLNKSAAVPGLNREDAYEQKIILPPLTEQKRIASLLRRADRLRQLRRTAHDLGDALLQSVFLEMFGDPTINLNKYEKALLSDLEVKDGIKCGPFGTQLSKSEFKRSGVPLWGIKHVNKKFNFPTDEFLSPEKAKQLKTYSLLPGDIVMTRKGTVGNCSIYPSGFPEGIMHSDLLRIRIDKKKINEIFLSAQLMFSHDVEHQISLISGGAVMEGINVGKLESIVVLVPPLSLQEEFAGVVARVESLRGRMGESERQVDGLFESLLAEAFS